MKSATEPASDAQGHDRQPLRFSANLGFLWIDRALPDRIHAAAASGFDAVECHFPYGEDKAAIRAALRDTGLPMLALNTAPGDRPGDFGLAALPGREDEARAAIREALEWAAALDVPMVHVMAGKAGPGSAARKTFLSSLVFAGEAAREAGKTILIEPINDRDVPGYHLTTLADGCAVLDALPAGLPVRLMADLYHVARMGGELAADVLPHLPRIGHVQIASLSDRGEPDPDGCEAEALVAIVARGWRGAIGAEYRPRGASVEAGIGWLGAVRNRLP